MNIFHLFKRQPDILDTIPFLNQVKQYVRNNSALYRHYAIEEVQLCVSQHVGVNLTNEQTIALVQALRDECGMGPIAEYNLPGYVEE